MKSVLKIVADALRSVVYPARVGRTIVKQFSILSGDGGIETKVSLDLFQLGKR